MIIAVELVPAATPVTVTKPVPLTTTMPDAVAVPAHVYKASWLVICTVKPAAVRVGAPNIGVSAEASDCAMTGADPPTYPVLAVVIVAVELVAAATRVTVTKPLPLTNTTPDAVAVPVHS